MFKKIQTLKKLLILLLILSGKSVVAQFSPPNTLEINVTYSPESKYTQKDGDLEDTKKTQKRIDLGYSFLISDKVDPVTKRLSRWTGFIDGSYTQMSNKVSEKDVMPEKLLSSQLGVSYFRSMGNNWGMLNILSAGVNSDLKKVDVHDLFVNGGVLFIKTYSPRFSIGFGGFVVNALNAPMLFPAFAVHFQTDGKLKFNVDIPTEVSAAYDVTKKMELKLAFKFRNMIYDTENKNDPQKRYLNYMELPLGLENKWKSKHFDFVLGGGYMFLRNYSFNEGGLKHMYDDVAFNKLGGNFYVNAGIRYRLKTPTK
ncbi:hypothetical protein H7F33_13810 [Pedobacter sp. PAMC26386]|nr:hypothetical protein H7F33_13810 [Pedobacter sp. PAMC26386]